MASASCSSPGSVSTHRRAPRSKSGCLTCRRRKVRCNEQKPRCSHCERLNLECSWRPSPTPSRPIRQAPAPETSQTEYELGANIGSSSTSDVALLQNSGQAVVDGPFNDTFNYASFMWDQDLQAMQPARWRDLGFPDMDVFANGDDLEDVASLNSSTFVPNGNSSSSQPFFSSQRNSYENQDASVALGTSEEVAKERLLEQYFIQTVVPPIIAQVETQIKWSSMRQVLISMSTKSRMVHYAILAFSELLMGRNSQTRAPGYQKYYESAKTELRDRRSERTMNDKTFLVDLEYILATLFFLSYIDLLEGRIVDAHANLKEAYGVFQQADKTQLRMVSKRLISWLRLLDGRAVSAGGEGLFLLENEDMLAHSSPASTDVVDGGNNEIEADIEDVLFDALYQPGFFFFQRIQSFMGRIAKIDPWHRTRGTVEDETEVMSIASKISRDLGTLWNTRPPLMDYALNGKLTSSHISASLAFTITRTFRTYYANFNASRIHLHRVAYKHLPLSRETEQAISNIRNTARIMSESGTTSGLEQQMLPVNMLWPLLMWGCEENDLETREWIIVQINNMQQVATNAKITAQVLTEVQKRQDATKQRVDVRTVMHDIFNSCFAIV
ncbi:fungal-specific transcription factor domain-containing protein [Halenospora varia]|nr:fungal-specific transcription factor domain-containing protein [Halenospora varia]